MDEDGSTLYEVSSFDDLHTGALIHRAALKTSFEGFAQTESRMQAIHVAESLVQGDLTTSDMHLKGLVNGRYYLEPKFRLLSEGRSKLFNPDALVVKETHDHVTWLVVEAKHAVQTRHATVFAKRLDALQQQKSVTSIWHGCSAPPNIIIGALCSTATFPIARLRGIKYLLKCGDLFKSV